MPQKMDIKTKLKQSFVIDKIKATNWDNGNTSPLVVEIDTTEVCNLACPGCISSDLTINKNSFKNDRLMRLAEEFHEIGVRAVIFIGGGEPLAHPSVGKFMTYLGEHNIHIGITTNGTFIDKYLDIIAKCSNWTRVSMDASTEETHFKLRPGENQVSKFNKIIGNMRKLSKIKKGRLGYSFLIRTEADGFGLESNISELYDAAVLSRDIGCDYFEVKPSYSFNGGVDHALVKHDPKRMAEAKIEIERLGELETGAFKITKAINLQYSLEGADTIQPKKYTFCPVTELRTLISPSGVYVCPYWRGKSRFRIGDLMNNSFKDMWNGERRKKVMEYLDPSKHCPFHCLRHESNLEIFRLIELIKGGENIIPVDEYDRFI